MKILYILRGVSGSGKTTLAQTLTQNIVAADDYFSRDGEYNFDPAQLGKAHEWCKNTVEDLIRSGCEKICVHNTSTRERDLRDYYEMAETFGYTVFCLVVENRHGGKDTHGVPESTLKRQEQQLRNSLKLR